MEHYGALTIPREMVVRREVQYVESLGRLQDIIREDTGPTVERRDYRPIEANLGMCWYWKGQEVDQIYRQT